MILELENINQDGVKAETKLACPIAGFPPRARFMSCDGKIVCMCTFTLPCQCSDCSDQPGSCFKNGELDQEYINRKYKENPESIPMN